MAVTGLGKDSTDRVDDDRASFSSELIANLDPNLIFLIGYQVVNSRIRRSTCVCCAAVYE